MYLANLNTTPKGHLIKTGTFIIFIITSENDSYWEKYMSMHGVLNGLNSNKFLQILNSNKTPNYF